MESVLSNFKIGPPNLSFPENPDYFTLFLFYIKIFFIILFPVITCIVLLNRYTVIMQYISTKLWTWLYLNLDDAVETVQVDDSSIAKTLLDWLTK
jgi:hypothetical protein